MKCVLIKNGLVSNVIMVDPVTGQDFVNRCMAPQYDYCFITPITYQVSPGYTFSNSVLTSNVSATSALVTFPIVGVLASSAVQASTGVVVGP